MRKLVALVTVVVGAATTAWVGIAVDAQDSFRLRIASAPGRAAANLPVFIDSGGNSSPLGTTNAAGELEVAFDASKNGRPFNMYRLECKRLVMHEVGTPEDKRCEDESRKTPEGEECGRCRKVGTFVYGRDATIGEFGGGHMVRNVLIGAAAAGAVAGVLAARDCGSSAPATPPFANLSGTYQLNALTGNAGCPGFTPTATAVMTLTLDPNTGAGTASVQDNGSRTDYANALGAFARAPTWSSRRPAPPWCRSTRSFTANLRATVAGGGTVRTFQETFMQITGAGSPCNQIIASSR